MNRNNNEVAQKSDVMIYVVLPAYNEELGLEKLVLELKAVMEAASLQYSIVIVNDGSKDGTLKIAQKLSDTLPVQVIDHGSNRGLGEALKSGLGKVQKISKPEDIIITMDADNTHPPDLIPLLIAKINQGYNLVIASRFVKGAREFGLRAHRKLLSRGASLLLRTLFPAKNVKDYTSGYRAYRAGLIQKAFASYGDSLIREKGFNSIAEILLKLRSDKLKACEVPLLLHYDYKKGPSKMPILKTMLRYGSLIARNLLRPNVQAS
jgi:dolichol-phosphate mannosyltransferase